MRRSCKTRRNSETEADDTKAKLSENGRDEAGSLGTDAGRGRGDMYRRSPGVITSGEVVECLWQS